MLCPDAQHASNLSLVKTNTSPRDWSLRFKAWRVSSSTPREANWVEGAGVDAANASWPWPLCPKCPACPGACPLALWWEGFATGLEIFSEREASTVMSRTSRDIWSRLSETEWTLEHRSDCDCWNSLASLSSSIVFVTTSRFKAVASDTFEVIWSWAGESWACSCLFWPATAPHWLF